MPRETFSLRIDPELQAALSARVRGAGRTQTAVINRDLARLYALYDRALRQAHLTLEESLLLCDSLHAVRKTADISPAILLGSGVADSITLDHLDAKWGVDGGFLLAKLQPLTEIQAMALIDAAERFWAAGPDRDARELAAAVFRLRPAADC